MSFPRQIIDLTDLRLRHSYTWNVYLSMWDSCGSFLRQLICLDSLPCTPSTTDTTSFVGHSKKYVGTDGLSSIECSWRGGWYAGWCGPMHTLQPPIYAIQWPAGKKLSLRRITFGTEVRGVDLSFPSPNSDSRSFGSFFYFFFLKKMFFFKGRLPLAFFFLFLLTFP